MNNFSCNNDHSLFSNAFGFLRLPLEFDPYTQCSDWVITGVPFDMATSGRPGSRFGPTAIRQASINLVWEQCRWPWNFNIREKLKIIDCGDLVYKIGSIQNFTDNLQIHIEHLLNSRKKVFLLGGDHYITLPALRAYSKIFGKIAIIHFDAHTDCYSNCSQYDHGAVMLYALNEGLINPNLSIQIGIRTEYDTKFGFTILDSEFVNSVDTSIIVNKIISVIQNAPVYLTFDIDCLDPSIAPGTGTPVIGGLTSSCVLKLIRSLKKINIIGMDIVEVSPEYDCSQITALTAATLGLEMLYTQAVIC
ncbi:agmatinase [Candidatus Blochmanniella vafra str. BVAF]|uniref:Agmatinase n=1 Tax=Blochmanniella vafra (strain BVAF) TaxID=859654 RepID=E8Q637_BLOVB|nr:agmatinase [Candidatus Blochmannia vafer]ADV33653.1 agmatinase [Candidatus Blochmannia vafer str. BVAF]